MDGIVIAPGLDQEGEGISLGLARGPVVLFDGENLAGEGMGIGAVAAKHGRTTYFARRWTGTGWRRTFVLDTRMGWAFLGCPSRSLAESIEAAVGLYMRTPRLQPVALRTFRPLRRVFCINPVFETVPPAGRATVTLGCRGGCATVQVGIEPPYRPGTTFCLLNELSADVFTASPATGASPHPRRRGSSCRAGAPRRSSTIRSVASASGSPSTGSRTPFPYACTGGASGPTTSAGPVSPWRSAPSTGIVAHSRSGTPSVSMGRVRCDPGGRRGRRPRLPIFPGP